VVRELAHEIQAYEDFCAYRESGGRGGLPPEKLEARRAALQARMRRRRRRERDAARSATGNVRSPIRLW